MVKLQEISDREWDYLVVLDACRYDSFEKVYLDYLEGNLEKRQSRGSSTQEWLAKTFKDKYDLTYISANPYVNSFGIPLDESYWGYGYEWNPTDHFEEIIDVWHERWDEELGTVHPRDVNMSFFENPGRERTIIHYMQPHFPLLNAGRGNRLGKMRNGIRDTKSTVLTRIKDKVGFNIEKYLNKNPLWMFGMLLDLDLRKIVKEIWRNGFKTTIMKYYEENLRLVLETVSNLIDSLRDKGKIIVTADHGEAFGENGVWEHHIETHIPTLIEVPWLEVN
ncbi:MAG: Arylsulfatase A family enzyme [Candidatus Methanohalarchaeum thermophilum]|uniref:Arylsulfatase A family enzyme n=1 Tax=Methanohalarchaeum thermophilum TaxID=1903181 RepID=A0A1Q6DRY9_METT1|nr:MAG: Arylsulfatase A family enzyme [Candidatus Methanohalarchaeum thermophilum]